ncbi:hypothetical protein CRG98_025826, partial [Punica granatum]
MTGSKSIKFMLAYGTLKFGGQYLKKVYGLNCDYPKQSLGRGGPNGKSVGPKGQRPAQLSSSSSSPTPPFFFGFQFSLLLLKRDLLSNLQTHTDLLTSIADCIHPQLPHLQVPILTVWLSTSLLCFVHIPGLSKLIQCALGTDPFACASKDRSAR